MRYKNDYLLVRRIDCTYRKLDTASKARQFLTLTKGWTEFGKEWESTVNAANNFRRFAYSSVRPGSSVPEEALCSSAIYFQRRVMTKGSIMRFD